MFIKIGVKVGIGAIIGIDSVVTHDVESYSIVAGNLAKIMWHRVERTIRENYLR